MHSGSCLCKSVAFEMEGDFDGFYLCHCSHCRKTSGSAHSANLFSRNGQLTWTRGKEEYRVYDLEGTRFKRAFCETCGSALPNQHKVGWVVPAGSLDTELHIKPSGHIFTGSRANWDYELEKAPGFETFPL